VLLVEHGVVNVDSVEDVVALHNKEAELELVVVGGTADAIHIHVDIHMGVVVLLLVAAAVELDWMDDII